MTKQHDIYSVLKWNLQILKKHGGIMGYKGYHENMMGIYWGYNAISLIFITPFLWSQMCVLFPFFFNHYYIVFIRGWDYDAAILQRCQVLGEAHQSHRIWPLPKRWTGKPQHFVPWSARIQETLNQPNEIWRVQGRSIDEIMISGLTKEQVPQSQCWRFQDPLESLESYYPLVDYQ